MKISIHISIYLRLFHVTTNKINHLLFCEWLRWTCGLRVLAFTKQLLINADW